MLQASLSMFLHSPVPTTSCHTWCRNHVSFEVPLIASSWPDTDLLPPVHLSFTRPPSLLPPALTSMFEPLPACPIPGRYLTGSKPGLTGGQAVSQAHRREQGLSSLISSSVFPWPQPHRSKPPPTPSTFLLRKQHAKYGEFPFYWKAVESDFSPEVSVLFWGMYLCWKWKLNCGITNCARKECLLLRCLVSSKIQILYELSLLDWTKKKKLYLL